MKSKLSRTQSMALVTLAFALASLTAHAQWTPTATLTASDGRGTNEGTKIDETSRLRSKSPRLKLR